MEVPHELPKTSQYEAPLEENKQSNKNLVDKKENKDYTRSSVYSPLLNASLWFKDYSKQQRQDKEMKEDIAVYFIDNIIFLIKDNLKRFSTEFKKIYHNFDQYCPHWNLEYWEQINKN